MSYDQYEDRLDAPDAEGWKPQPGDKVVGKILEISQRDGDYGPYKVVTIEKADGVPIAIHAFHSVLAGRLEDQKPGLGDIIGVKYEGKKQGAKNTYDNYKVTIFERAAGSPSLWGNDAATDAGTSTPNGTTSAPAWGDDEEPF